MMIDNKTQQASMSRAIALGNLARITAKAETLANAQRKALIDAHQLGANIAVLAAITGLDRRVVTSIVA